MLFKDIKEAPQKRQPLFFRLMGWFDKISYPYPLL